MVNVFYSSLHFIAGYVNQIPNLNKDILSFLNYLSIKWTFFRNTAVFKSDNMLAA